MSLQYKIKHNKIVLVQTVKNKSPKELETTDLVRVVYTFKDDDAEYYNIITMVQQLVLWYFLFFVHKTQSVMKAKFS